jgi:uncharacterized coiled-coil DUF342 family protein
MLADAAAASDPTGDQIKTWLLVASFLANGLMAFRHLTNRSERREISGTVKEEPDFVTKRVFDQVNTERTSNVEKLGRKIDGLHESISGVHRHMESIVEKLREEIKEESQRLHNRVDEVHERANEISTTATNTEARFNDHLADHRNGQCAKPGGKH